MPAVEIDALPDDARVWVFAANDVLSSNAESVLLAEADGFLAQWRAHGTPLLGARELREGRFLCVAVDERGAGASGCSVDALFRRLREMEPLLGTSLIAGGQIFWRNTDGVIERCTREQFAAHVAGGTVGAQTRVFDVSVTTLAAWRRAFELEVSASWHARYLRLRSP